MRTGDYAKFTPCVRESKTRFVPSRHLFILAKEYGTEIWRAWEGGRKSDKNFAFFFRPSLDAPRTRLIFPINHSAYREATGYESDLRQFLDSWFQAVDSVFQVVDSSLCSQWDWDSGFRILNFNGKWDFGFLKLYSGFRNPYSLTWDYSSHPSEAIDAFKKLFIWHLKTLVKWFALINISSILNVSVRNNFLVWIHL